MHYFMLPGVVAAPLECDPLPVYIVMSQAFILRSDLVDPNYRLCTKF